MRIGIIAALQQEIADLLTAMGSATQVQRIGQRDYYLGQLGAVECVIVLARIGKVAASATCVTLIREFAVDQVVFTGLAGGLSEHVRVGDIILADQVLQHDLDASPLFPRYEVPLLGRSHFETDTKLTKQLQDAAEQYLKAQDGIALDVPANVMREFGLDAERSTLLNEHATCKAVNMPSVSTHTIRIHRGLILSGDQFISVQQQADELIQRFPTALATEMEGAAVAQICFEYEIPFAVLRVISDRANDDAHLDFDSFLNHIARFVSSGILMRWLGI